ncbi:ROK family protein [Aliamphritea spongicola]|nr:ROK family protein [Aliamphritea spongicola]
MDIAPLMSERLGIPICVETVPNALNLAETRFGITKGQRNVVMLNASLRMGASLLLDNQLRRGVRFSAGQIGKLRLHQADKAESTLLLDEVAAGIAVLSKLTGEADLTSGRRAADTLMQLKSASVGGDQAATDAFITPARCSARPLMLSILCCSRKQSCWQARWRRFLPISMAYWITSVTTTVRNAAAVITCRQTFLSATSALNRRLFTWLSTSFSPAGI